MAWYFQQDSQNPNIKTCVFDAYGILFDVQSTVGKNDERFGEDTEPVSSIIRTKQLEYTL
jgi:hypothetical protein